MKGSTSAGIYELSANVARVGSEDWKVKNDWRSEGRWTKLKIKISGERAWEDRSWTEQDPALLGIGEAASIRANGKMKGQWLRANSCETELT
ncbi:hypothetical protein ANO14919_114050 [Xylariales sp. No.14919]|nr:hypothetical protein ANO14919_114050 [Xylariales sp. No.14919]